MHLLKEFISVYCSQSLLESLINDIKLKHFGREEEWDSVNRYLELNLQKSSIPKYLKWLDSVAKKTNEPLIDIAKLFPDTEKKKDKLGDIFKFKTPEELSNALYKLTAGISKEEAAKHAADADVIYDSKRFSVVMPKTPESSIEHGSGTNWCTARREGQGENLFYSYIILDDVKLYYVLSKDSDEKWSIGVDSDGNLIEGTDGGVTIDKQNKGFTEPVMQSTFGPEFKQIISAIKQHAKKIKVHHARTSFDEMLDKPEKLEKYLNSLAPKFALQMINFILDDDENHKNIADVIKKIFIKFASNKNLDIRTRVASNPNAPVEALLVLSKNQSEMVKVGVASNPNTPVEALLALSKNQSKTPSGAMVKAGVASNPNTPVEALLVLSKNQNKMVKAGVASNPNAPVEALLALFKDESEMVKAGVASNPNTPVKALLVLSKNQSEMVRIRVASNPNAPVEALLALSKDESKYARTRVARNPNTPAEALLVLSKDENEVIRKAAKYAHSIQSQQT